MRFRLPGFRLCTTIAILAGVVCLSICFSLDPAGDYPQYPQGPGLTVDESINVREGVRLVEVIPGWMTGRFSTLEVFGDQTDLGFQNAPVGVYMSDYPPLARVWLGLSHQLGSALFSPEDHASPIVIAAARTGSAVAFAVLVFLVGYVTGKWYGAIAGVTAAISLVMMPRLFGHAHLASVETVMSLAYVAVVFSVAGYWSTQSPPICKTVVFTGLVFGLALLTKIQAILLPVPITVWALIHWRHRAIVPLALWGSTGMAVFFLLWPWLWLNPLEHFAEYFLRTTDRVTINVWYFGSKFSDNDVPWHYPAVMFLTTVPVGLHLLGCAGFCTSHKENFDCHQNSELDLKHKLAVPKLSQDPRLQLVLICFLFPLLIFSLPGVVVYDGVRLFLIVFPLWAVLIGRGSAVVFTWLAKRWSCKVAVCMLTVLMATQSYGIVSFTPCYLSYYNLFVGGLRGAERLGLEPTYWGDSMTRDFLEEVCLQVPEGAIIDVMPVLQPTHLKILQQQSPVLRTHQVHLRPYNPEQNGPPHYMMIYNRKADLSRPLRKTLANAEVLADVQIQGVRLAALYELP